MTQEEYSINDLYILAKHDIWENAGWLAAALFITLLNVIDGVASVWGIQQGYIVEANPFMIQAVTQFPIPVIVGKVVVSYVLMACVYALNQEYRKPIYYLVPISVFPPYLWVTHLHIEWITAITNI
ncbi:DUF5658 family protein [Heliophilum fasciatum]|uniref:DUF5658 domain-containing protein n=1 Tax=Heliophilum fasciatum TaxID=35700 RepID=A0A4R2RQC3_9FIRM|nr:DUF5658 family protein [Heliophilum fasciatum]MCW2278897.1 hypothetical protein [Heliophilum fasciatum]TCP62031.1 hypothetical protein EDD73_1244 [Heliophilum fasciatum]